MGAHDGVGYSIARHSDAKPWAARCSRGHSRGERLDPDMAVSAPPADAIAPEAVAPDVLALPAATLADGTLGPLLSAHERAAYNLAYRLLRRDADARDAVQDAFMLVVRAVRGDGASPHDLERFTPWIMRLLTNAAVCQLPRRPPVPPVM